MKNKINFLVKLCVLISFITTPVLSYAGEQEFDILGIKLGDTIVSAKNKIKNKIKNVNFKDHEGAFIAQKYKTPKFFFGCTVDNQWIKYSANFSDDIQIACEPTSADGQVVGITRLYNIRSTATNIMPTREVFFKALFEKYGKPDAENKQCNAYLWYRETNHKSDTGGLMTATYVSMLASGGYNHSGFKKEHGTSLTCSVSYDETNKDLISRYRISLVDNVAANNCIKKVNDIIETGIADLRKKESQKSEGNKPIL